MVVGESKAIRLPGSGEGGDAALVWELGEWLGSWAMRDLAAASGWAWPAADSVAELAHALAALSADWDFRARQAARLGSQVVERSAMPTDGSVVVGELTLEPRRVLAAATALGLVNSRDELDFLPSHVVVLGGTARANVNRARRAAELVRKLDPRPMVVGLTAHRELKKAERDGCAAVGLPEADTEWITMRDALTGAFDLGAPELVQDSGPDEGGPAARFGRSAEHRWGGAAGPVELFVTPSPTAHEPQPRPANTSQQLEWWSGVAARAHPGSRLLLVTTQIYVPYQQLVAVGVLRRAVPGCRIVTVGVDATNAAFPTREFTGRDYLQEIRSALLAAARLVDGLPGIRDVTP